MVTSIRPARTAYDEDFDAWLREQAACARRRQVSLLDLDAIAEELEGLSKRDRRALRSQLRRLMLHLLKWRFQPDGRKGGWQASIRKAREAITDILTDSPGLLAYLQEISAGCYRTARAKAAAETALPPATFPETPPFTLEQALDEGFWPE